MKCRSMSWSSMNPAPSPEVYLPPKSRLLKQNVSFYGFWIKEIFPSWEKTEKHFGKSCLLRFMNYIIINMKVSFYASLTLRRGWNPKFGKRNCLKSSEHVVVQRNVKNQGVWFVFQTIKTLFSNPHFPFVII